MCAEFEGGWCEEDKAGSHHRSWPWQQFQAMGCTMGGGRWLIAPSRNFICIGTGRGGPQCPCGRATITISPGYTSTAEVCMLKRGLCMGTRPRDTLAFRKGDEGLQTMEPRSIPEDVWGGVGISLSWGVLFFFLLSSPARGRGAEREGGSGSSAALGARLAAAVPYSIFWSPCEPRSLVEPAVVSEWKTSHAITLGQAAAACPQRVPACSAFLWQKPAPNGVLGWCPPFCFHLCVLTLFPIAFK